MALVADGVSLEQEVTIPDCTATEDDCVENADVGACFAEVVRVEEESACGSVDVYDGLGDSDIMAKAICGTTMVQRLRKFVSNKRAGDVMPGRA